MTALVQGEGKHEEQYKHRTKLKLFHRSGHPNTQIVSLSCMFLIQSAPEPHFHPSTAWIQIPTSVSAATEQGFIQVVHCNEFHLLEIS